MLILRARRLQEAYRNRLDKLKTEEKKEFVSIDDVLEEIDGMARMEKGEESYSFLDFFEKEYLERDKKTWRRAMPKQYKEKTYIRTQKALGVCLILFSLLYLICLCVIRASEFGGYLYISI